MNPRIGHTMTWQAQKEPLEYIYGTDGRSWKLPGLAIYGEPIIYKEMDGGLEEVVGCVFNYRRGLVTVPASILPTDTLVADYISESMPSAKLFHSTAYIYATPDKVVIYDKWGKSAAAFCLGVADEGTIQHTFDETFFDEQHPNYDPSKLLLAKVRLTAPICMSNIASLDTRERGGDISTDVHAWDVASIDGKILSGNTALLIRIPYEITRKLKAGEISETQIDEVISRHMAAGAVVIKQFENEYGEYFKG